MIINFVLIINIACWPVPKVHSLCFGLWRLVLRLVFNEWLSHFSSNCDVSICLAFRFRRHTSELSRMCQFSFRLPLGQGDIVATGWTVRVRTPVGGKRFPPLLTRPDRQWRPPSILCNRYWGCFPGVKRPGRGVEHPPPSSAEVKKG